MQQPLHIRTGFFAAVAALGEYLDHTVAMVALNDDLPLLGRAADAAFGFQQTRQFLQIRIPPHEAFDQRHHLARALLAVEPHAQLLPRRGKRLRLRCFGRFIVEVGIGRIDHSEPRFPIVVRHIVRNSRDQTSFRNLLFCAKIIKYYGCARPTAEIGEKERIPPSNGGARPHVDGSGKAEPEKKRQRRKEEAAQRRDSAEDGSAEERRQHRRTATVQRTGTSAKDGIRRRGPEPAAPPLQKIPALGRNSGRNHYLCFRMAKKFGDKLRRFNPFTRPATLEELPKPLPSGAASSTTSRTPTCASKSRCPTAPTFPRGRRC